MNVKGEGAAGFKRMLAVLMLLTAWSVFPAAAAAGEAVEFEAVLGKGAMPQVTFIAKDADDIYAYDLTIAYDESRLRFIKAEAKHNGFMVEPKASGNRIGIAHTLVGPRPGLSGNVELITLSFERIAPGEAYVSLVAAKLVDADIESVAHEPNLLAEIADDVAGLTDIAGHWAEEAIEEAARRGIVKGFEDGAFRPGLEVTRAEFTVMLARALTLPASNEVLPFSDAASIPAWAADAVGAAAKAGLAKGYNDGAFRPGNLLTRSEMTVMLMRSAPERLQLVNPPPFVDAERIQAWAQPEIEAAAAMGIVKGKLGGRFAPHDHTTRAEAVTVIINMLNILESNRQSNVDR